MRYTYEKDQKITTNFEPVNDEDVINKAHLDEKNIQNRCSFIVFRKGLQRILITIQQTICRRDLNSEGC